MDAATEANRRVWETASHKHIREYDDLLALAASGSSLNAVERAQLAGILVGAPEVVHLQSGHGIDDTALVQAGREVGDRDRLQRHRRRGRAATGR